MIVLSYDAVEYVGAVYGRLSSDGYSSFDCGMTGEMNQGRDEDEEGRRGGITMFKEVLPEEDVSGEMVSKKRVATAKVGKWASSSSVGQTITCLRTREGKPKVKWERHLPFGFWERVTFHWTCLPRRV